MKTCRKPTSRQLFVLMEYQKQWSPVMIQRAYNQSVYSLQRKGLLTFNEQRGKYEVTTKGAAAADAERARRSKSNV